MAEAKEIQQLARILNLQNIASGEIDLNDEKLSNKDYIYNILLQEVNIRHANKTKDIRKQARLPKKVFDKTRITEGLKWQLDKLCSFDFASARQNIFIVGDCSTGKTSLAVTIGNEAIEKGARVIYIKFDDLLAEKKLKKKIWNYILNADLGIVDDIFYMTPTNEELEQAYKIMMFLQETRSLVLITNRALSSWKEMKVDSHLVETLQKRLMQGAQLISLA